MEIKELKNRPGINQSTKLNIAYVQFNNLLHELRKKKLSDETLRAINNGIVKLNAVSDSDKDLAKQIKSTQLHIIKLLEKDHKMVTKNHYRNLWLALGMAAFGIPLGVAFGAVLDNMALLAIGLPIGMLIGIAVGTRLDKKAHAEGRQIDVEVKA
ncbi:hypothetical protein NMK71_04915 [Weeksellaceae bacterium KMM 9713]|uniref:Uncharacterized protein n=1 Tax=Profundicola chukchiensis TaxID=2961959 RepID=A0A9X4RWH1_9FLAO|nr:hypothetical protein [Profundicola chukchiensis]MDG4945747.1 hypothetical protein [Profundicola chukchiensis]